MGVPVLTLPGTVPASRAGLSILANIALHEYVATSEADYVARAVEFAGDIPRLTALRASLRDRMKNSPLNDAPRFAREVERVYRDLYEGRRAREL
jgi:predicted O-linked N-acetylglucosamine transferase (SPINDLY family)